MSLFISVLSYREHLIDLLNQLIFQVLDLDSSLAHEKDADHLPPPIDPQMSPQCTAVKDQISQAGL